MSTVLAFALLASAGSSPSFLQDRSAGPARVAAPVQSVALFKNGLGVARRAVRVPPGVREVEIQLPVPTHGTFSIGSDPARVALSSAVAREVELPDLAPASSLIELLRANLGREVELTLADRAMVGRLLSAGVAPTPRFDPYRAYSSYYYPPAVSDVVVLGTAQGTVALRGSDVMRVSAGGAPLEVRRSVPRALLELTLDPKSAQEIPLELTSLERGWSWAPSYSIELGEDRARLAARAVVFDEVEDLENATLRFVTGFPNLRFAHVPDPLALQGDLEAFLAALGRAPDSRPMAAQQVVMANVAQPDTGTPAGLPEELAGQEAGDLFVIERRGVSLKRGERLLCALFQAEVPCRHVYQWEIRDRAEERPDWWRQSDQDEKPLQEEIWHSIRLQNDTPQPWTTAPAMTTRDGLVLGQDILHYAATGALTTVRITRAVDVQAARTEIEVARERDVRVRGNDHDRITVQGRLRVTSYQRAPIALEIEKELWGEVKEVPAGARREVLGEPLGSINPHSRLTWELTLEPATTVELTYEYVFLAP